MRSVSSRHSVQVREHGLAALPVELLQADLLLHLALVASGRAASPPPAPRAGRGVSHPPRRRTRRPLHGLVAADEVLHGAGQDVVHARLAVGGGRALEEDERPGAARATPRSSGRSSRAFHSSSVAALGCPWRDLPDRRSGRASPRPSLRSTFPPQDSPQDGVHARRGLGRGGDHRIVGQGRRLLRPNARSVTTDRPSTFSPACTATMVSGTVDIPTRSAPMVRSIRSSADVS